MYDSEFYNSEIENELSLEDCKLIVDDYVHTLKSWSKKGGITFTGGDPLLREDFWDLLYYTGNKQIDYMGIAGNSYCLTVETAKTLKKNGVSMYQISLDGMKDTHDSLRMPGSFEDTIRGYEVLKEAGISPMCMFTLSKYNMNELLDVIRLCAELGLAGFDFDRMIPTGNAADLKEEIIDPNEYRELLIIVNDEYNKLRKKGYKTLFGFKDNLWGLVLRKEDLMEHHSLIPDGLELTRGCLIGLAGISVLADGTVLACRRLPVKVGTLPEQSISNVFIKSNKLNEMRNFSNIEKCGLCKNADICRGCRAIAYSCSNNNYFAEDPGCWL